VRLQEDLSNKGVFARTESAKKVNDIALETPGKMLCGVLSETAYMHPKAFAKSLS
jgi:hypothetical protein